MSSPDPLHDPENEREDDDLRWYEEVGKYVEQMEKELNKKEPE